MKKTTFGPSLLFGLTMLHVFAQTTSPRKSASKPQPMNCATPSTALSSALRSPEATVLRPAPSSCVLRYLNVNVHFIQKDDGSGNFNQYHDGLGNTQANGYRFADTLIDIANTMTAFNNNPPLWFYPAGLPRPDNLPLNIQLILKGVYYHKSSAHYSHVHNSYNNGLRNTIYRVKNDTEINIFVQNVTNAAGQFTTMVGEATNIPGSVQDAAISVGSPWQVEYKGFRNRPVPVPVADALHWSARAHVGILVHEIGHLLNLYHTEGEDYCNDTPPNNRCWNFNEPRGAFPITTCDDTSEVSNNVMDYTAHQQAFSPCQIGRMNATLAGNMAPFINTCIWSNQFYCPPVSSYFDFPAQADVCKPAIATQPVFWAEASYGESSYSISLNRTDSMGSSTVIGTMLNFFICQTSRKDRFTKFV